ncbi:hypothetical protein F2P81_012128 [Scophthalmus maximus]|uniref:Uncharacterized protein n=1 Tax=Scophthalmus maximus TaxID=52904 RepID=A0A6A4SNV3_SCOMX|nr:hypothetical protein F2P81_012128 [Scophthalmus maximus]
MVGVHYSVGAKLLSVNMPGVEQRARRDLTHEFCELDKKHATISASSVGVAHWEIHERSATLLKLGNNTGRLLSAVWRIRRVQMSMRLEIKSL